MTETKSPYQLQQIQTSRYRPPPRPASTMNPAPYFTYHKNNSHWTSECPVAAYGRRPAPSTFQVRRSSQTPNNTWRRNNSTYNNPVQRDIRPSRPAFDRRCIFGLETKISVENSATDTSDPGSCYSEGGAKLHA